MAKTVASYILDLALTGICSATHLTFCGTEPSQYSDIATMRLVSAGLTPGVSGGDFTIGAGDTAGGRKVTVGAKSGMTPTVSGTVNWATLDDGVTMIAKTTVTSATVFTTETWNSPAFKIEIQQPA